MQAPRPKETLRRLLAALVQVSLSLLVLSGLVAALRGGPKMEPGADHNCRLWGLIAEGAQDSLIRDHLYEGTYDFARLANTNSDGWGIVYFMPGCDLPLQDRARTKANHPQDTRFPPAVEGMLAHVPQRAIVHLRKASTGAIEVPDPHPLLREGVVFAHNGTIDTTALLTLLGEGGSDFLTYHPPDYLNRYLDSELYLLYILRLRADGVETSPGMISHAMQDALAEAARRVYDAGAIQTAANVLAFVDDTLFALRFDPNDLKVYKLRYRAVSGEQEGWEVCSEPVGSDTTGWAAVPAKSVGIFRLGEAPDFLSVIAPARLDGASAPPAAARLVAEPNPAGRSVTIAFETPRGGEVDLAIHDVEGRLVRRLLSETRPAQQGEILWDRRNDRGGLCEAGVYFVRLRAPDTERTSRIVLSR